MVLVKSFDVEYNMPKDSSGSSSFVPAKGVESTGFPQAKYSKILVGRILFVT